VRNWTGGNAIFKTPQCGIYSFATGGKGKKAVF